MLQTEDKFKSCHDKKKTIGSTPFSQEDLSVTTDEIAPNQTINEQPFPTEVLIGQLVEYVMLEIPLKTKTYK